MPTLVSLAEASSYLGVSKATLRNWDKEGKLKAHRHPLNKYRAYALEDLRALRTQLSLLEPAVQAVPAGGRVEVTDLRSIKRVVGRLHDILRNTDGGSSIIERFDELTKLLFLRLASDRTGEELLAQRDGETAAQAAARIRGAYAALSAQQGGLIPQRFARLKCSDAAIAQCAAALAAVSFEAAQLDVKGVVYEEVIRGTFDKSDHQQFFTPHQVVSFMVSMMRPFLKGSVCDPACGTAGFLAEVVRSRAPVRSVVGLEIDDRLAWVSGMNLLLHGCERFAVSCLFDGGTLGPRAREHFGGFDAIITNPPFGSDVQDPSLLEAFSLGKGRPSRRRGILFIERCWELLKKNGVLAIVIDEGVLNQASAEDVRRFILERFDVLAIVGLPEDAFKPYASVNASILLLRRSSSPQRSRHTFFARAENVGRKANGDDDITYDASGNASPNSDLPEILRRWELAQAGRAIEPDDMAFVANVHDALADDRGVRLDFRYHHPARMKSRALLEASRHELVALSDLCEERNDIVIPSKEMPDQVILYTGLANMEAGCGRAHQVPTPAASIKSAVKRYEMDDILFARMRPNLRKVAHVTFEGGGYASPECSVLVVRQGADGARAIEPALLAAVLRSDLVYGQIMHLIAGIGRPRLNVTDLRQVRIPLPSKKVQEDCRAEFDGRRAEAAHLRARARSLDDEAAEMEQRAAEHLAKRMVEG